MAKYGILMVAALLLSSCHLRVKQANGRGVEYMKQERYKEAIAEFDAAIRRDALWLPAYYNRAVAYANAGRTEEALRDFNYVIANHPEYADAYFNRGIVHENLGRYAEAIQDYTETVKLRPDFIMAYHYRGIARFRMQDFRGALADYDRALQLGKGVRMEVATAKEYGLNASALYFNRGAVLQKLGEHAKAIKDYSSAIETDPASAKAYYNRAIAHLTLKDRTAALADLEIAARLGYGPAERVKRELFPE